MAARAPSSSSADRLAPALAAAAAMAVLAYGFLLAPGRAPYSPHSDFVAYGLGSFTVLRESLEAGHGPPLWRGDELSGNPALTDPSSAYTSPLNLPFWLAPPAAAVGPALWLYFLAAGLVGCLAGAALRLGTWGRIVTAATLMFSFKLQLLAYSGGLLSLPSVVLLPLLYAAVLRAVEEPGPGGVLRVALSGALCLHSGQPQLLYYSALFLATMVLGRAALEARAGRGRRAAEGLGTLAAGALLAAGLSAFLLLPLAADASLVSRREATYEFFLSRHALSPRHLLTFLRPEALGTPLDGSYPGVELWEDEAYFGLVPLLLALGGAALHRRRALAAALAAAFAASVLLALESPVQKLLFDRLPGFSLFRLPGRLLFLSTWFGAALAGLGAEALLERLRLPKGARAAAAAAAVLLIAAEGAANARRYLRMVPQERLLPGAGLRRFFAERPGTYRVVPVQRSALNYGWMAPLGLDSVAGYESLNLAHYQAYCDLLRWGRPGPRVARVWTDFPALARPDLLDALGARYLVSRRPLDLPPDRFAPAGRLPGEPVFEFYEGLSRADLFLYENLSARPRAFFVDKTVLAGESAEAFALVQGASLEGLAVVEAARGGPESPAAPDDQAEATEARGGRLALRTRSRGPRFLVIGEVWHPGWRASLDGRPLALHRTDIALLGAWVPAGEHRLVLDFRPPGWRPGLLLAALSALLCALLARGALRSGRRPPP